MVLYVLCFVRSYHKLLTTIALAIRFVSMRDKVEIIGEG